MKEFFLILRILLGVDIGIVVFCYLENNILWLINTQLAFLSVSMIILGSFIGYANLVKEQISNGNVGEDILKKYEDRYDLDEDETVNINNKEIKNNKKLKWYESIILYFKGGLNLLRIFGYISLIGSFLWLNYNNLFDYLSFLFGVTIVPAVSLIYLYIAKKRFSSNNDLQNKN